MEQDHLQSMWQGIGTTPKKQEVLRSMLQKGKHPEQKRIRKQLSIEILVFSVFLVVYYDFFDGDRRPLYANVLLVTAILLTIVHNLIGYKISRKTIKNDNIKKTLEDELSIMKGFALAAVTIRALTMTCLLFFFTSIITLNTTKLWILACVMIVFIVQVVLLCRLWMRRIRRIRATINSFDAGKE